MKSSKQNLWLLAGAFLLLSSCVSKKEFLSMQAQRDNVQNQLEETIANLQDCTERRVALTNQLEQNRVQLGAKDAQLIEKDAQINRLSDELDFQKKNNSQLLERLSDLSVISKTGAENIKRSLESIDKQNTYIRDLNSSIQRKDSVNLALVTNLKRSLANINDEDIEVEVKKGVVYISISDKLLFQSGSAVINTRAKEVLGKVATVVNDHSQLDILVEGHTDNIPIASSCIKDNWDLSVKRATAVVRVLQDEYSVDPTRMTAGGRSEFIPKASNETREGRSTNRRTEIVITPKLDEFFQLLEAPAEQK